MDNIWILSNKYWWQNCRIVEDHEANYQDKPLFLVMSYPNPHSPIQVPEEFIQFQENAHIENSIRSVCCRN